MPIIAGPGDPGSIVDLCAVFLNTASDPTDVRSFEYVGDALSLNTVVLGEVRQNLGRLRLVRRDTGDPAESVPLTLPRCTSDDVAWLKERIGVLTCFRDHKGSKFFGVYWSLPRDIQVGFADRIEVKLTVEQVTHSEAV